MSRLPLPARWLWSTAAVSLLALVVGWLAMANHANRSSTAATPARYSSTGGHPAASSSEAAKSPVGNSALAQDIAALNAASAPPTGAAPPPITGLASKQPDLYAAEFVRRLLTQHYDTPRDSQIRWVQSESGQTHDPTVVGLVPPNLRGRLATYSVTAENPGDNPIPDAATWARLGHAHASTTVTVQNVEEPLAWTNAVADGKVQDPGVTAREVAATVTRHVGHERSSYSVDLTLNLEGPPAYPTWRFVTLVTYTSIPLGPS
ncbi:hypothetical protein [Flexivirga alba]|uniref:Uncharacterized protein n=1 Tax=Flexivirga alba TaxID=702742 RepID=A0ABW2AIV3_9MICO